MESAEAFQTLLDLLKILEKEPYDVTKDPIGLLQWRTIAQKFSSEHKLKIAVPATGTRLIRLRRIVEQIVDKFQSLVEHNRMSRLFHVDGKPRHERFAQLLFYSIAVAYCDANNIDVAPEANAGAGPVDFKFSTGSDKVVVEVKLSTNAYVVEGFQNQLTAYEEAESTGHGFYLVINVGRLGHKWERVQSIHKKNKKFEQDRTIRLINGIPKLSASQLKSSTPEK